MRYTEHAGYVNAVCGQKTGTDRIASASDDGFVKVWDTRTRRSVHSINQGWPATAVALNDGHNHIYTGGIDNDIKVRNDMQDT
jgi:Prp8 binding protein